MNNRERFEAALAANEYDTNLRLVFSDWLEEHDEPEEADRMRKWPASKAWMTDWVRSINYNKWQYDEDRGYLLDGDGKRIPAKKDNLGDPHTLKDAIEAGKCAAAGKTYCWGTDAGQDYFFTEDFNSGDSEKVREWFRHWSVLTGVAVPNLKKIEKQPPFRCAC